MSSLSPPTAFDPPDPESAVVRFTDEPINDEDGPNQGQRGRSRLRKWTTLLGAFLAWSLAMMAIGGYLGYQAINRSTPDAEPVTEVSVVVEQVERPESVDMAIFAPDVAGLSEEAARGVFASVAAGVEVRVVSVPAAGDAGRVVGQVPLPGAPIDGEVTLELSTPVDMPDVTNMTITDARRVLEEVGARVFVTQTYQRGVDRGIVLSSDPAAGATLALDATLVIAAAPAAISLAEIEPIDGGCSTRSSVSANAVTYLNAIECSAYSSSTVVAFNILREIDQLTTTLALADDSESQGLVRVEVLIDGVVVFDTIVSYGQSIPLDITVSGVLRLELRVTEAASFDASVVFGDALLIGGTGGVDRVASEQ